MRWIDQNGNFFRPPLIVDGVVHNSPTPELLLAAGYTPYTPKPNIQKPQIFKFDCYRVIEVLGDKWIQLKQQLETQGLLDYFMRAPYLSTGDPKFLTIYKSLSSEDRKLLHQKCVYGRKYQD